MLFEVVKKPLQNISADVLVLLNFEGERLLNISSIDSKTLEMVNRVCTFEDFKAKKGKMLLIPFLSEKNIFKAILIVGLGKKAEFNKDIIRQAGGLVAKRLGSIASSIVIPFLDVSESRVSVYDQALTFCEGIALGNYKFEQYKSKTSGKKTLETVIFSAESKTNINVDQINQAINFAHITVRATILTRDLVNQPQAIATPTFLAELASSICKKNPEIKCRIYDKNELEKMGMGSFLGIARASDTPAKFIHLEYTPKKKSAKTKLAIIGKGITFDSGGINVKPGDHMQTMKIDMSGAAAVLGVFSVISELKPEFCVLGLIAATPNLISNKGIVPGDVVKAYNGKTIEILNTDAEGRVTMADSLSYAVEQGATHIIDLATLTGACLVALGEDIAGFFGNNKDFKEKVKKASDESGEKIWELPLENDYKSLNKSNVADLANIPSTRYAGTITAALFLQEFIDGKPWVHLDVAGPVFLEKDYALGPKGATGFGASLLLYLLKENKSL